MINRIKCWLDENDIAWYKISLRSLLISFVFYKYIYDSQLSNHGFFIKHYELRNWYLLFLKVKNFFKKKNVQSFSILEALDAMPNPSKKLDVYYTIYKYGNISMSQLFEDLSLEDFGYFDARLSAENKYKENNNSQEYLDILYKLHLKYDTPIGHTGSYDNEFYIK